MQIKKIYLCILSLSLSQAMAINCPNISELKSNVWQGWQAYTTDNGTPLSYSERQEFATQAAKFVMAEWAKGAPEGEAHCYYIDKQQSYTLAFLAQKNLSANMSDLHWFKSAGFLRCVEPDPSRCPFK